MLLPIGEVDLGKRRVIPNYESVFGVFVSCCGGEIEAARFDMFLVDFEELVVLDGMHAVDANRDAHVGEECSRCVLFAFLAFINDDLDIYAVIMGIYKGLRDWFAGEAIGEYADAAMGRFDGFENQGFGGIAGRESDFDGGGHGRALVLGVPAIREVCENVRLSDCRDG